MSFLKYVVFPRLNWEKRYIFKIFIVNKHMTKTVCSILLYYMCSSYKILQHVKFPLSWSSHYHEDSSHLGCDAMCSGIQVPMFWRRLLPPASLLGLLWNVGVYISVCVVSHSFRNTGIFVRIAVRAWNLRHHSVHHSESVKLMLSYLYYTVFFIHYFSHIFLCEN